MGYGFFNFLGIMVLLCYMWFIRMPLYQWVENRFETKTYAWYYKIENTLLFAGLLVLTLSTSYVFFIDRAGGLIPWWVPVGISAVCSIGFLAYNYWDVLRAVWLIVREPFLPLDKTDLDWRVRVRKTNVRMQLQFNHQRTWHVYTMLKRAVICRLRGHKWGDWEKEKLAPYIELRHCKCCLAVHQKGNIGEKYYDGHFSAWEEIPTPDTTSFKWTFLLGRTKRQ